MAKLDPKEATLQAQGALNPRPAEVADELFEQSEFFDARDLVQVKYEMLRRVRVDGRSVTHATVDFGFSRPSYYQAREAFERGGLAGLIPKKRGPKGGHKLTDTVLDFIEPILSEQPSPQWAALAERLEDRFGLRVHPRSVERAFARRRVERRQEKRGRR
jgi:transposase